MTEQYKNYSLLSNCEANSAVVCSEDRDDHSNGVPAGCSMSNATDELDRFRGCLLGLAVGDAVGTTVEFASRDSFPPLTDMTGGGPRRHTPR
jgi:ADP-ribosylglycohydrolase